MCSNVRDMMTRDVVSVPTAMTFKQVARTLVDHAISAVPVVDAGGAVAGVVSEADLLRKEEFRELYYREFYEAPGRAWGGYATGTAARRKAEALTAADLMTAPAVTVRPDTSVVRAVRMMDERGVKRLLVVGDDGRLAGIVSRSDLLRLFVRDDRDLETEIREKVLAPARWLAADTVAVAADDGVVTLTGHTRTRSGAELAARMAARVNGVVDVVNRLGWEEDDLSSWRPR
ncbi:CBS domain-containing protein [Sphaerisporangium sp. B11E5]|uniref:CBS domain-containing protein n=1 Tax=Sphaerisporangium sp. B11E5 TaxID=3153563 RepID=UPI00325C3C6D